ncbi:DUF3052 domain-containing protein [Streptomyces sp. WAC 04229]|uniref:DUF3052 domain-containing protein n=1 Tax=Streptomyces sp. WAC 04229 TaxID=2203206 RepID=UPI003D73F48A
MTTEERTNLAARLGFRPDQVVQEIGYDDDADQELRGSIEKITGRELVDEEYDDHVDALVQWFRDGDGDLSNTMTDAIGALEDGGVIWLLTPKPERDNHVEPSDIREAAQTAGLSMSKTIDAASDWSGTRLVVPKR